MLTALQCQSSQDPCLLLLKDQRGGNYSCENEALHGPLSHIHTFLIHAATAQEVLEN